MWYRFSNSPDKQKPSYEMKVIAMDADLAIRKLCYLQQNYNPSDLEISSKVNLLIEHLENKYGSIANVRLYTKGDSLEEIVSENVYELFGKGSSK